MLRWQLMILLLGVFLLLHSSAAAQNKPLRRVLILNEAGTANRSIGFIDQGIRTAFQNSPYKIEFYREYLETILFPDPADQQRFREFYIQKYQNRRPDVIITVGPGPLKFMLDAHERSFSGIPVVFCLLNGAPRPPADSDFTGVEDEMAPAQTLEAALRLAPATKRVVVIGGTSAFDRQQEAMVREQLNLFKDRVDITYLTNLSMPALLDELKRLAPNTIVLLTTIGRDAAGTQFTGSETGPLVANASNAPVFALHDVYLNDGEVGGDVVNLVENAKIAGNMALRILSGERPQDIPRASGVTTFVFDWRALKRWNFKEKNLPPGSIVLNQEPTVWEAYKGYIIGGISLILLEAALISALVWHRALRRRAETDLAAALTVAQESERRFRLVANTAPVMIWMAGPDKLCSYLNQPWLDFTGQPLLSQLGHGWTEGVHPDDLQRCMNTYTESFDRHEPFTMQYRLRRRDGEYRWVLDIGAPRFNSDGSFAGYIGSVIDITERKLAEEALSSVSRRLIDAQEQERTRIARELHDNINQRIAMLGIELDVLQQSLPDSGVEAKGRLDELRQLASDIGTEIQGISHRLHSSKLEYLGLVAACKSFCKEIAEWHKVQVEFTADNIPASLTSDISLCLFRVLQEALNNAIKHSGAQRFEAQLRGTSTEIQLIVRDHGIGFDAAAAMVSRGLGLISMRERVSVVNGSMLIASK
ncbi:MAG TPA: PAS domain S-box protein, partial [Terriglobales bacterium]|nr:PAS domain S-box protein [Terriglobales bacterium]